MTHALDVVGRLMVEMGGSSAEIEARGDTVVVGLPSLRAGSAILRRWRAGPGRREAIRRIHDGLIAAGLRLEVRVGSRTVGRLGRGARAGVLSRLLGVDPMELKLGWPDVFRRRVGVPPER